MDFKQLEYFMAVYEAQSISRATEKLHVAQPALSMQIRRLEEQFGGPLFHRTHRGVIPTDLGRRLYDLSWPVLRDFSSIKQMMQDAAPSSELTGRVRCGFPPPFFKEVVVRSLFEFKATHPNVEVEVVDSYSGTLYELVRLGSLDFAFGAWLGKDEGIISSLFVEESLVLVSRIPLAAQQLDYVDLSAIPNLDLIVPSVRSSSGPMVDQFLMSGHIRARRVMVLDSLLGGLEIVRQSDWAFLVPVCGAIGEHETDGLFVYPVENPPLPVRWHLLHRNRAAMSVAGEAFSRLVVERFTQANQRWLQAVREHNSRIYPSRGEDA